MEGQVMGLKQLVRSSFQSRTGALVLYFFGDPEVG
jgi:hypothetical protein